MRFLLKNPIFELFCYRTVKNILILHEKREGKRRFCCLETV